MSLMRLFIDEDSMDQRFVSALRARGEERYRLQDLRKCHNKINL